MNREHLKRKKLILISTFLLMICISVGLFCRSYYYNKSTHMDRAGYLMTSEKMELQNALDSSIMDTQILEMLVINSRGNLDGFHEIAPMLYDEDNAIRAIELAPKGVVSYIYPVEKNREGFFDLFSDPDNKEDAKRARDTGETTLAGPIDLKQGGKGMVVRDPIYLTREDGKRIFWGFSIVVFDVPEIFKIANLELLTHQKYYYQLLKHLPESDDVQFIAGNCEHKLTNAIRGEIAVPNATWYLDIEPMDGWVSRRAIITWIIELSTVIILVMLTLSAYLTIFYQRGELIERGNILQEQNITDSLTGVKNGRFFMRSIHELCGSNKPFEVFYMDLDNFKMINDNFGHDEGDRLLIEVANRLKTCVRMEDIVARIGGDEFVIAIVSEESFKFCLDLKSRIKESVGRSYDIKKTTFFPNVSVGFARFPHDAESVEEVIRLADQRMYDEKRRSKEKRKIV